MKVFKNRALAVLLALCVMISLLPVTAMAAAGDPVEKLAVSVASNGKITVKSSSGGEYTPKETLWYQSAEMWDDPAAYDADGKLAQLTVGMTSDGVNGVDNLVGTVRTWSRLAEDCNNELIAADRSQSCFVWVVDASGDEHSLTLYAAGYAIYSPGGSGSNGGNSGNGSGGQGTGGSGGGTGTTPGTGTGGDAAETKEFKLNSLAVGYGNNVFTDNLISDHTYATGAGKWGDPWRVSADIPISQDTFTFKAGFIDADRDVYYRLVRYTDDGEVLLGGAEGVYRLHPGDIAGPIAVAEDTAVKVALLPEGYKPRGGSDGDGGDSPEPFTYELTVNPSVMPPYFGESVRQIEREDEAYIYLFDKFNIGAAYKVYGSEDAKEELKGVTITVESDGWLRLEFATAPTSIQNIWISAVLNGQESPRVKLTVVPFVGEGIEVGGIGSSYWVEDDDPDTEAVLWEALGGTEVDFTGAMGDAVLKYAREHADALKAQVEKLSEQNGKYYYVSVEPRLRLEVDNYKKGSSYTVDITPVVYVYAVHVANIDQVLLNDEGDELTGFDGNVALTIGFPADIASAGQKAAVNHDGTALGAFDVTEGDGYNSVTVNVRSFSPFTITKYTGGNGGNNGGGGGGGGASRPSTNPSASGSTTTPSTPTTPTTPSTVGGFSDVPASNTFATQIAWAQANGYMGGYSDGTFRPNANTTRQALWMVLGRIAGAAPADMAAARAWAVSAGISDGTGPEGNMSRQQMITMLYRFAQSQGQAISGSADLSGYSDSGVVASYAREAIAWGVANGIITGTTDGKLNPEGVASRAHFAAFLYRYANLPATLSPAEEGGMNYDEA